MPLYPLAAVLFATWATPRALADEPSDLPEAEAEAPARQRAGRRFDFEFGARVRRMTVPRGMMDIWYTDADEPGWPLADEDRPFINGWAFGGEFVLKDEKANAILWIDWIDSAMPRGYWDDADDPPDFSDGDYLVPSGNVGIFSFGADYLYEIPLVRHAQTKGVFGMGLGVGAGLGVGFLVGTLNRWIPDDDSGDPAYAVYYSGQPPNADAKKVPRVYPMVDFNLGLRLNFANRLVIRLEGGLHTMLYYGGSVGFQF